MFFGIEQFEQRSFLRVLRLRGVSRRRADAAIFFGDQFLGRQRLIRRVGPQLLANALVHVFRHRLGKPVRQRLHHDGGIVVALGLQVFGDQVRLGARRHHKRADPVLAFRRDEIRQRIVRALIVLLHLLAQREERVARLQPDIVAHRVRAPEADHRLRLEPGLADELLHHCFGVAPEPARRLTDLVIVEDLREPPGEIPG